MKTSLVLSIVLGILCVIGAYLRNITDLGSLSAILYNRILLGFVLGLIVTKLDLSKSIARGFLIGVIVSFAYYSANNYTDLVTFIMGPVYGMIIEYVIFKKTQ
jgi:hypothetical protein